MLLTGLIKPSLQGSTIIEVLIAMIIMLASFSVLLRFGVQMAAKNRVEESFKQLYGVQTKVEGVKGNDAFVFRDYESRTFSVDDSVKYSDSIIFFRVVIRDRMNRMVSFSDFYLTNEEE